ncbi:MAG: hypothetical protein PUE85_09860 [Firmicutes bacterium]|nr:hypothetical protein [Bacillota bacterium]
MKKRLVRFALSAVALMALVFTSSCSYIQGFAVSFQPQSYIRGVQNNSEKINTFSNYINNDFPIIYYEDYIYYFFWEGVEPAPKCPARLNERTGKAELLCKNPNCYHNCINYTERCILCDIVCENSIIIYNNKLYYVREDRSYFNERKGTIDYVQDSGFDDETEFPQSLIEYDLETGEYKILYYVGAEGYINDLRSYNNFIYFFYTDYYDDPNYEYINNDSEYFYFNNINNTDEPAIISIPAENFYLREIFESRAAEDEDVRIPRLENIRDNRIYKVSNGVLSQKKHTLARINIDTGEIESLIGTPLSTLPDEFQIFGENIYILEKTALLGYDIYFSKSSETVIFEREPMCEYTNFQYDAITSDIYFLTSSETQKRTLASIKDYDQGYRKIRILDISEAEIDFYQLTVDGIYFTEGDGNFLNYISKAGEPPLFNVVYNSNILIENPTVYENFIYAELEEPIILSENGVEEYISFIKIDMRSGEVTNIWPSGLTLT